MKIEIIVKIDGEVVVTSNTATKIETEITTEELNEVSCGLKNLYNTIQGFKLGITRYSYYPNLTKA
jgi:hypothetical protein